MGAHRPSKVGDTRANQHTSPITTNLNPLPPDHISPVNSPKNKNKGVISVMCVALSISTIIIIIATVVLLAVTLTYSHEAANEFAETYSINSISAAQNKVNDFVKIPVNAFEDFRIATDLGLLPDIPATATEDREAAFAVWQAKQQPLLFSSEFLLLHMGVGFTDATWLDCAIRNKSTFAHVCTTSNAVNTSLLPSQRVRKQTNYIGRQFVSNITYDPRIRPWYMDAPKTRDINPIFSAVYVDYDFLIPVVDINGPLYSSTSSFMGVSSITLDLRQISTFLSSIPRTTNGLTVLMDEKGYLLGASNLGALYETTAYNATIDGALAAACGEVNGLGQKICRHTPETYDSPVLRELASKDAGIFSNDHDSFTKKIKLGGEQWIISKALITAKTDVTEATISWQIFTLMPVSDVTGEITEGTNAGIAVAAIMVVASSVSCGVALYVLLRPLSVLSKLLEQAAELKDDSLGATMDKSSMREIRAIQDSFERLSAQLKKAKSFLPASLLAQLESSGDEHNEVMPTEENSISLTTSMLDSRASITRKTFPEDAFSQTNSGIIALSAPKKILACSDVSLTHRSVTVAVLNLRNFHCNALEHTSALEASYGKLVDEYQRIAKEHRGIMDSFHGDRFTFTFNTVRPCATHAAMAATAMLKIVASMEHNAPGSTSVMGSAVTCGVATGRCLVGNLGSDKAKRYTVIGPAFSHATVLERLCKRYPNTSVLLSAETSKDCETHIGLLYMDVIDGPGRKAVPIAAAKYLKESPKRTTAHSEWMYEVNVQSNTCDYHSGNCAFMCALNGDDIGAQGHLASFNTNSEDTYWVKRRILDLVMKGKLPADLGSYYSDCVRGDWDGKIKSQMSETPLSAQ